MSWAALLVAAIALLFVQSTYEHHTGEQLVRGPSKGDRADTNSHCQLQVTSDLVIRTRFPLTVCFSTGAALSLVHTATL